MTTPQNLSPASLGARERQSCYPSPRHATCNGQAKERLCETYLMLLVALWTRARRVESARCSDENILGLTGPEHSAGIERYEWEDPTL